MIIEDRALRLLYDYPKLQTKTEAARQAIAEGRSLQFASLARVNLSGMNLSNVHLRAAHLRDADLSCCILAANNLNEAILCDADLTGADLRGCTFRSANLSDVVLDGATLNWGSHELISEILWQAADYDIEKEKVAAFIGRKHGMCWDDFVATKDPLLDWALDVLAGYVQVGDRAPAPLRVRAALRGV